MPKPNTSNPNHIESFHNNMQILFTLTIKFCRLHMKLRTFYNIQNKINSTLFINGDIIYETFIDRDILSPKPNLRALYMEFIN